MHFDEQVFVSRTWLTKLPTYEIWHKLTKDTIIFISGGVAQMVERSLSMREVPGSIPGASKPYFWYGKSNFL